MYFLMINKIYLYYLWYIKYNTYFFKTAINRLLYRSKALVWVKIFVVYFILQFNVKIQTLNKNTLI